MYYRLTVRNTGKSKQFAHDEYITVENFKKTLGSAGASFEDRLKQIQTIEPNCIDWEMVEDEDVPKYTRSDKWPYVKRV